MATITMSGIARLARVQRPVVSMWRSRTLRSDDPFPAPVDDDPLGPRFDSAEIAAWLVRTGRGNNPDAVLDAAAHSMPAGSGALTTLTALLALRELHGSPIGALDAADLMRTARDVDPDDTMLRAEIAACGDDLPALAHHIDAAVDADYSASAALDRMLIAARVDRGLALSEPALQLVEVVAQAVASAVEASTGASPTLVLPPSGNSPLLRRLVGSADREGDVQVPAAADADVRMLRRMLTIARQATVARAFDDPSTAVRALHVLHLPATGAVDPLPGLAEIDDVALSLAEDEHAIVVGPAATLIDSLQGEPDRLRSNILRLSRVRSIVRLPRGCAPGAPRAHLAMWLLGPTQHDVSAADRTILTIDLDDIELTDDVRHDATLDVISSLGDRYGRHLRAFRFGRSVPLRTLLALGRELVPSRVPTVPTVASAEVVSRFFDARSQVDAFASGLPRVAPLATPRAPSAPKLLGDLVRDRRIRRYSGTRVPESVFTDEVSGGFRVISAAVLRGETAVRYVDRLRFAQLGRSARLTEPGDVIVVGGERPTAMLDTLGSQVVEAPAAILRVDRGAEAPVEPALLAHDIRRFASGDWRTWPVRQLALTDQEAMRGSLADIGDHIAQLREKIAQLKDYEQALVDGFVAGVLTPAGEHTGTQTHEGGH